MPTAIDFAFVAVVAVIFPIWGFFEFRRLKREIAAGNVEARARAYVQVMLSQWALAAVALGIWFYYSRPWGALGFASPVDWRLWTGVALTAIAAGLLVMQWWAIVRATGENADRYKSQLTAQLEPVKEILPHNRRELRRFLALSVTAGVCEELLFRAYLIWFLAAFTGLWIAAAVSTVIFAAAHLYQGPKPAVKIIFIGAAMAGLYLLSRSIWLPMLVHALIDLISGLIAFRVLSSGAGQDNPTLTEAAAKSP